MDRGAIHPVQGGLRPKPMWAIRVDLYSSPGAYRVWRYLKAGKTGKGWHIHTRRICHGKLVRFSLTVGRQAKGPGSVRCVIGQGVPPVPLIKRKGVGRCLGPGFPHGAVWSAHGIGAGSPALAVAEIAAKIYFLAWREHIFRVVVFGWAISHFRICTVGHDFENPGIIIGLLSRPPRFRRRVLQNANAARRTFRSCPPPRGIHLWIRFPRRLCSSG